LKILNSLIGFGSNEIVTN